MKTTQKTLAIGAATTAILAGSLGGYRVLATRPLAAEKPSSVVQAVPAGVPAKPVPTATRLVPPPAGWVPPTDGR